MVSFNKGGLLLCRKKLNKEENALPPEETEQAVSTTGEALQNELRDIKDDKALAVFLEKNACSVSVEEFVATMKARVEGEITEEAAEATTGGLGPVPYELPKWSDYLPIYTL